MCREGLQVPKCILIVDDSPVIRKALRQELERHDGWEVCGESTNGREGVEMAQQLKPDLVLLDFSMPIMNGLEAARELKRLLPSMPLLMFTNYGTDYLEKEALSVGISAVVSKAGSIEALVRSIQVLLGRVS